MNLNPMFVISFTTEINTNCQNYKRNDCQSVREKPFTKSSIDKKSRNIRKYHAEQIKLSDFKMVFCSFFSKEDIAS